MDIFLLKKGDNGTFYLNDNGEKCLSIREEKGVEICLSSITHVQLRESVRLQNSSFALLNFKLSK